MNPYVGLRPFRSEDRDYYFGRETITNVVATRALVSPITVMFARSGVGKSSFLTCRLIKELGEEAPVSYVNEWGQDDPSEIVRDGLSRLEGESVAFEGDGTPILVLDQFEDVFKRDTDRSRLWKVMARVTNSQSPTAHLLLSMREEWLGALSGEMFDYVPTFMDSLVRLAPLKPSEVRRAILNPVKREGSLDIEDDLAEVLLDDLRVQNAFGLGDRYVEPGILQLVCSRLWDEAANRSSPMSVSLYDKLGRVDTIVREHVWRKLAHAGSGRHGTPFSVSDRVLWIGVTKRMVAAHGVKASVTPESVCRTLSLADFGIAGPAFVAAISRAARTFLERVPEKRGEAPPELVSALRTVMDKGVDVGFLKRQKALESASGRHQQPLYEYAHDALADVFALFAIEFESWYTRKLTVFGVVGIAAFVVLPVLVAFRDVLTLTDLARSFVIGGLVVAMYGLVWFIIYKAVKFIVELISFPILRFFARGKVPMRAARNIRKKTASQRPAG